MTPDHINAIFEAGGAFFTWRNALQLYCDKQIKGVYWKAWFFFAAWGLWNCWYYPQLDQWFSFVAGIVLVSGNITWCLLALIYKVK